MGLTKPVLLSVLTLIIAVVASDVDGLTSNSAASFPQFQAAPNAIVIDNANGRTPTNVQNDSADNLAPSLSRHVFAKTGGIISKAVPPLGNKRPHAKARSSNGVAVSVSSSGDLVIASSSTGRSCVTIKKPCGTSCSPHSKSIGMCSGGSKPKFCFKKKKVLVPCPGKKVKMCKETKKVPDVCEKKVQKKVRCPDTVGKRTVCAYPKVEVHTCKKLPPRCSKIRKKKCRYQTTKKKYPCRKPTSPCQECFKRTAFQKCEATITRKVEVPCGDSKTLGTVASTTPRPRSTPAETKVRSTLNTTLKTTSPTPSSTPSPSSSNTPSSIPSVSPFQEVGYDSSLDDDFDGFDNFQNGLSADDGGTFGESSAIPVTFGGTQGQTRSLQCFASLFDEDDCKRAPLFCQLFDDAFDSDKCTQEVCRECDAVKNMRVGRELREYCRDLSASCRFFSRMLATRMMETAAVARTVEKNEETKKCYKNETKTVTVPCNHKLTNSEICLKGCRVGICQKIEKKRVTKYCEGYLPKDCYQNCKRKMVKRKVCHTLMERKRSKKVCRKDKKVKYKCYKKKTVKKPCKQEKNKLCKKSKKVKYVCGKVTSKITKCTGAKGEKKCKTKLCVQKKCS